MADFPRKFPVEVIDWGYADRLCRRVAAQIKGAGAEPDVIVGITRGGWFPARCLADQFDVKELYSLMVDHYTDDSETAVSVRDTVDPKTLRDRRVLIVDDSVDTGETMDAAVKTVHGHEPSVTNVALLQGFEPFDEAVVDYVGQRYDEWRFIVNPWEFTENMVDITNGVLVKAEPGVVSATEIYELLEEYHEIFRSDVEIVHPEGLHYVLEELVVREVVEKRDDGWELLERGRVRYRNL